MKVNWTQTKEKKIFHNSSKMNPFNKGIIINEYVLFFIDYEIIIYRYENEDLLFETKKNIDFISLNEEIIYLLYDDKKNKNILFGTDKGNIYIISLNLNDFYIEVLHSFEIRQNYIYEYEVLSFSDMGILVTFDKNLFLCDVYSSQSNKHILYKNCLMKIEYFDEKIISAFKIEQLVVIFTNKAIYFINLDDGGSEIIFKKDNMNYYSGLVLGSSIYFVKDDNSFCSYNLFDKDKKYNVKLTSKNQLNKLNFYKVVYVTENYMVLSNEKNTEIYFISLKNFKIVNREPILFEKSLFLMYKGVNLIAISLNVITYTVKFKVGIINNEDTTNKTEGILDKNILRNDLDLSNIEEDYVLDHSQNNIRKNKRKRNKLKIWFYLYILHDKCSNYQSDKFSCYKNRILKCLIKIKQYEYAKLVYNQITSGYINAFGSALIIKSYALLYTMYFYILYKENIDYLIKISTHIQDYETSKELYNLYIQI